MGDDDTGRLEGRIAEALGITGGALAALAAFAERIAEAESFSDLVLNVILTEIVDGILSLGEYLFGAVLTAIDAISESFWESIVSPIGMLYGRYTSGIIGGLESVQGTVETAVASTGLAAPFVALAGWLAVLLVVAVLVGVVWALAETYLPTEAITGQVYRLIGLLALPVRALEDLARGAVESLRGETSDDGGTDEA